jgi:hypothetical protein
MLGQYKKFSAEDYENNNARAVAAVLNYLNSMGLYARENDDRYGVDIIVYGKGYKHIANIEVEIKYNWKSGEDTFPYDTIQLPERKRKFRDIPKSTEFWVLRPDLGAVVIIPDTAVREEYLTEVPNSKIASGELFYKIPLSDCIVKSLS